MADDKDINRVLGKLSWADNPENEKELLQRLTKYPLVDILTLG